MVYFVSVYFTFISFVSAQSLAAPTLEMCSEIKFIEPTAEALELSRRNVTENVVDLAQLEVRLSRSEISNEEAYFWGLRLIQESKSKNHNFAVRLLSFAAENGSLSALGLLGSLILNSGERTEYAISLLKCAADKGSVSATAQLGSYFVMSSEEDQSTAIRYLEKASEHGVSLSMQQLASKLIEGKVAARNIQRATQLYKDAGDLGLLNSRFLYARIKELQSVTKNDLDEVYRYYQRSSDNHWRIGAVEAARVLYESGAHSKAIIVLNEEALREGEGAIHAKRLLTEIKGKSKNLTRWEGWPQLKHIRDAIPGDNNNKSSPRRYD